ncbi:hypothetical protein [Cerasicoccus fimbriatus]|uniref:hypothetical protein n=1 Tax=Cerasicoccus fimbriatus TaxID=3014554 RepID=UPI0022B2E1D0|nr:hypothetical protein [Cerasicoccus sp. TK19100]
MAFILLLALSLTSLTTIETRNAAINKDSSQARLNALYGLQEAIGVIQQTAGPDQRVTARADILSDALPAGNKYWTGVWDNRILDESDDALPDNMQSYGLNRDTDGKLPGLSAAPGSDNAPRWLLSTPEGVNLTPANDITNQVTRTKVIVQETKAGANDAVEVPLVDLDGSNSYAWWSEDESLKVNVALPYNREEIWDAISNNKSSNEFLAQQLKAAEGKSSDLVNLTDLDWYDSSQMTSDNVDRITDFSYLPLLFGKALDSNKLQELSDAYSHDFTYSSYSLLTDTQNGGLKMDLSRALEEQWPDFLKRLAERDDRDLDIVNHDGHDWVEPAPLFIAPFPSGYEPAALPSYIKANSDSKVHGPTWDALYGLYHAHKPDLPYTMYFNEGLAGNSFYGYRYSGYSSQGMPLAGSTPIDELGWKEYSQRLIPHSGLDDTPYSPRGMDEGTVTTLLPRIYTVPNGPGKANTFMPQLVDFYAARPDFKVGQKARSPSEGLNRGEPVWNNISPVMTRAGVKMGLEVRKKNGTDNTPDTEDDFYQLLIHFYPYFVLWNPYNVSIPAQNYKIRGNFYIPLQFYRTDAVGTPPVFDESELIIKNYNGENVPPSDSGDDSAWQTSNVYELNPHTNGVFLNRLISGNSSSSGNGSSDLDYTTQPISFAPGEALLIGGRYNANSTLLNGLHTDRSYALYKDTSLQLLSNSEYNPLRGFKILLEGAVPFDRKYAHTVPDSERIPLKNLERIDSGGNLIGKNLYVRFFDTDFYIEREIGSPYTRENQGQGDFFIGMPHVDKEIYFNQFSPVNFINSNTPSDQMYYDFGPIESLVGYVTDFAIFEWKMQSTEQNGDLPMYSVTNPRRMQQSGFLGNDVNIRPALGIETSVITQGVGGLSNQPQASLSHDGVVLSPSLIGAEPSETSLALFDVPRQPIRSVTDFMHANISLFDIMPTYAIGSSYAPPFGSKTATVTPVNNDYLGAEILLPDLSYLSNDALYDEYFFSGVPVDYTDIPSDSPYARYDRPYMEQTFAPFEKVDESFIESNKPLPNKRLVYFKEGQDTADYLTDLRDMDSAASKLLLQGGFNVNSTSVDAWTAFLGSVRAASSDDSLDYFNTRTYSQSDLSPSDLEYTFLRFSSPAENGSYNYPGFASLETEDIRTLAAAIVDEVQARGPFLSMADFVNRRLHSGPTGDKGALQAAIDASGINDQYDGTSGGIDNAPDQDLVPAPQAGLPGYLLQNDILRVLGPQMRVRGDTFSIRSYGEAKDPLTGNLISKAMCEAVIQRLPQYVNHGENADQNLPADIVTGHETRIALSEINETFGRRFKLVSFRWLDPEEIPE